MNVTDLIYENQYTEDLSSRLSGVANIFCECSGIRMDVASEKLLVYGNLVADAVDNFSWKKDPSAALFSSDQRRLKEALQRIAGLFAHFSSLQGVEAVGECC